MLRSAFALIGALFFHSIALGQSIDLEKELAKCAALEGALERLECYDGLARRRGLVTTTSTAQVEGKWLSQIDTNPIDDSKTVILYLVAEEGASKWGSPVSLILRCQSNETEIFINWGEYLGSEAEVLT